MTGKMWRHRPLRRRRHRRRPTAMRTEVSGAATGVEAGAWDAADVAGGGEGALHQETGPAEEAEGAEATDERTFPRKRGG